MTGDLLARVCGLGVRLLPATRRELGRAVLAEAAALEPGPARRRWLLGSCWFIVREGIMTWLRWSAVAASVLFILWIVRNGIDSGFRGTPPQVASYIGLIALLTLNAVLLARRGGAGNRK